MTTKTPKTEPQPTSRFRKIVAGSSRSNPKSLFAAATLLATIAVGGTNIGAAEKTVAEGEESLPRVLLIGDSISAGYSREVKPLLKGKADVVRIEGNGEHTGTGLKKLDQWLGDGKWDVIHFNWGLWDIAYRNPESKNFGHLDKVNGTLTTSLPDYEKNLRTLVARLKKTGAVLIWASTTPVPDGEPGRIKGDEVKYNTVAAKVMADNGIAINDLYSVALSKIDKTSKSGNVHFKPQIYKSLGHQVADAILQALKTRGKTEPGSK